MMGLGQTRFCMGWLLSLSRKHGICVFSVSLQKEICMLTKVVLALYIVFLGEVSHSSTVKNRIRDGVVPIILDRNSWQCLALNLFVYS